MPLVLGFAIRRVVRRERIRFGSALLFVFAILFVQALLQFHESLPAGGQLLRVNRAGLVELLQVGKRTVEPVPLESIAAREPAPCAAGEKNDGKQQSRVSEFRIQRERKSLTGAAGGGRTHNLRLRRPTLYPVELRLHGKSGRKLLRASGGVEGKFARRRRRKKTMRRARRLRVRGMNATKETPRRVNPNEPYHSKLLSR